MFISFQYSYVFYYWPVTHASVWLLRSFWLVSNQLASVVHIFQLYLFTYRACLNVIPCLGRMYCANVLDIPCPRAFGELYDMPRLHVSSDLSDMPPLHLSSDLSDMSAPHAASTRTVSCDMPPGSIEFQKWI